MIVVHLIRKPLSEGNVASNVLKWGCGALNIDGTRLGFQSEADKASAVPGSMPKASESIGTFQTRDRTSERPQDRQNPGGRWPANLILEHQEGCSHAGTRRVPGTKPRPGGKGSRFKDAGNLMSRTGHEGVRTDHQGFAGQDGTETLPAWECAQECPVAELDRQGEVVGVHSAGHAQTPYDAGSDGGWGFIGKGAYGNARYGDRGGASRFFKQVCGCKP